MDKTINSKGFNGGVTARTGLDNITQGTSEVGIVIILTSAAIVGLWGTACLFGGIAKSGSLVEMGRGFLTAVVGM